MASIDLSNINLDKPLILDNNGEIITSTISNTELSYLSGVSSNIQNQLNNINTVISGEYPIYEDNDDALTNGLNVNDLYKTLDGTVKQVEEQINYFIGGSSVVTSQSDLLKLIILDGGVTIDTFNINGSDVSFTMSPKYGKFILKNTETVAIDNPEAKHFDGSAHSEALSLSLVNLPNCKEINNWSFYNCNNLTKILLPNVQTLGFGALNNMSGITELYLPKCTYSQQEAIQNNSNLRYIYLPKMTHSNTATQNSLKNNSSCTYLDISGISSSQWPNGYLNTGAASDTFNNYPSYGRVYFPRYFTTSNSSGLDGDMAVLAAKNWTLIAV